MRLSAEERKWFQQAAAANGTNVASWIRMSLREKLRAGMNSITLPLSDEDRKTFLEAAATTGQDLVSWMMSACKAYAEVISKARVTAPEPMRSPVVTAPSSIPDPT